MLRRRSGYSVRLIAAWGGLMGLAVFGCSEDRSGAGPEVGEPLPADAEVGEDAPVDLTYICGNRFLVTNAHTVPIRVAYRVGGSGEEGAADVPAAPSDDPAVSEVMIETRTKGTVQIFLDGKPLVARANDGAPCTPAPAALPALVAASADAGEWSATFTWPIVAVHMMLLPNGRVLSIGRTGTPQVWNPAMGTFAAVSAPANLFCSGHVLLSDGRVLVAGGHIDDNVGLPNITLFSSSAGPNGSWSSGTQMARGRWYPTATIMGDGSVVILAGRDQASTVVTIPEVWSGGSLRRLTGAPASLTYYPRMFLTPDGRLFMAGAPRATKFLSVGGSGSWKKGPAKMLARNYGSAVMYDDGKVLYAGGAYTTNTAETIDLNLASPTWRATGSMAFARRHLNLTVLPTGEVLATGGVAGTGFNDLSRPARAAELWNPATGQWTTLASSAITRGYHASSLLLPDGRVLHSGSGDGAGAPAQRNAELFSPPYLFKGARPQITGAPTEVRYGDQFRVLTPQAGSITQVSLIRLGAVTHAFDQNQRFQRLTFRADATGLTVTAPSSSNRAPPGHYMVFILNQAKVPSVARIVRIF